MELMDLMQTVASLIAIWDFPDRQIVTGVEQDPCINRDLFSGDSWEQFWLTCLICMASHLLSFVLNSGLKFI